MTEKEVAEHRTIVQSGSDKVERWLYYNHETQKEYWRSRALLAEHALAELKKGIATHPAVSYLVSLAEGKPSDKRECYLPSYCIEIHYDSDKLVTVAEIAIPHISIARSRCMEMWRKSAKAAGVVYVIRNSKGEVVDKLVEGSWGTAEHSVTSCTASEPEKDKLPIDYTPPFTVEERWDVWERSRASLSHGTFACLADAIDKCNVLMRLRLAPGARSRTGIAFYIIDKKGMKTLTLREGGWESNGKLCVKLD